MQFGLNGNKNANNKRRHTFRTSYEAELRGVIPNVIFNCVFFYKKKQSSVHGRMCAKRLNKEAI